MSISMSSRSPPAHLFWMKIPRIVSYTGTSVNCRRKYNLCNVTNHFQGTRWFFKLLLVTVKFKRITCKFPYTRWRGSSDIYSNIAFNWILREKQEGEHKMPQQKKVSLHHNCYLWREHWHRTRVTSDVSIRAWSCQSKKAYICKHFWRGKFWRKWHHNY